MRHCIIDIPTKWTSETSVLTSRHDATDANLGRQAQLYVSILFASMTKDMIAFIRFEALSLYICHG